MLIENWITQKSDFLESHLSGIIFDIIEHVKGTSVSDFDV